MKLARRIDGLTAAIGRAASWLVLVMVLIGAGNAVARYLGRFVGMNLSSNAYLEAQWYLFSLIFLLGAAYTLQRDDHVRVDVLYARLSRRTRAWIDSVGTVVFLIPFCLFCLWVSWPSIRNSWQVFEGSPDPGGLPRYPIKTVILISFVLLILQGVAILIDRIHLLRGEAPADPDRAGASHRRPVA